MRADLELIANAPITLTMEEQYLLQLYRSQPPKAISWLLAVMERTAKRVERNFTVIDGGKTFF